MATSSLPRKSRDKNRFRRYVLFVVFLLLAAIITTAYYKGNVHSKVAVLRTYGQDIVAPFQSVFLDVGRPIGSFISDAINDKNIAQQNKLLTQEIQRLKSDSSNTSSALWMLQALTNLNALPYAQNYSLVPAQVIAQGPSNFELSVEIDKGTSNGIAVGMPVVNSQGLVGRVIEAGSTDSIVLLLPDARTSVSVSIVNGSNVVTGILSGTASFSSFDVSFVQPGSPVKRGDEVITSSQQGNLYPPGIPVGTVSSVVDNAGSLQMGIKVKPSTNFSSLIYVAVLQWLPSP